MSREDDGDGRKRGRGTGVASRSTFGRRQQLGLLLGPLLLVCVLLVPPPAELRPEAWRTAGLGLLMATWWLTEAIPIPATALVPLVGLPLLGAGTAAQATAPFGNPIIFLFLGGFLVALALERWGLHRRIALFVLARSGKTWRGLVAGFMTATAALSMWVSNTATAMMMLPIGLSVVDLLEPAGARKGQGGESRAASDRLGPALLLGIAYGASLGGLGTLVGTPPNAFLAAFLLETYGIEIGFARWMLIGVPVVLVGLPLAHLVLTRVVFRVESGLPAEGRRRILEERERLGPMSGPQKRVAAVFGLTVLGWLSRPLLSSMVPGLSDPVIAMAAGLALFLVPAGGSRGIFLLDWASAEKLPWDVLILFGGGLSLASAVDRTGLSVWLGSVLGGTAELSPLLFTFAVVAAVLLLTELTSNTATAAAFLPAVAAVAVEVGWGPLRLTVPAALAASCAFMLPVATPPNAIVYGSGRVAFRDMVRAGILLNGAMLVVAVAVGLGLVPILLPGG